jgi:hypothetical protein
MKFLNLNNFYQKSNGVNTMKIGKTSYMDTPSGVNLLKHYLLVAVVCAGFGVFTQPAIAAVQMDGHMDFVLSNGRTIRVFPEAVDTGPIAPGNILPVRQKVTTTPASGDPCKKLEDEYKKKTGSGRKADHSVPPPKVEPNWVKRTSKLKATNFRSRYFLTQKPTSWYYLPNEPRVSFRDNIPEATFVKFITDETGEAGGTDGGLFHLMVTYGLTQPEEKELQEALKEAVPGAVLKGMVDLEPSKAVENFIVTSGTLSDKGFAPSGILTSGRAPTYPGSKAAIAGRLSSLGAQLLETTFENPTSDLSVTFAYDYIVKTQAYKAEVRIDMDRVQETMDCALRTRDKSTKTTTEVDGVGAVLGSIFLGPVGGLLFGLDKNTEVTISEKDLQESYDTLINLGAIEIKIDQNIPDADVSAIESSMMQLAMESFTSMNTTFSTAQETRARQSGSETEADKATREAREKDIRNSDHYRLYSVKRKQTRMTGVQTLKIEKGIALYRTHSMTGNLGGILREHKDKVFDEVLLNDPFFKRGSITVDLDTKALELFAANMVNNASVEISIPFPERPYKNGSVFTRAEISGGDITKKFTFATRGDDMSTKPCLYYYLESWSLSGGGKWPAVPEAKCAKEMAVTLTPPIEQKRIDVEADFAEFEEMGIRGADVLFRHKQYNQEKIETARFRTVKPEPFVVQNLFVDKSNPVIEYQIVLTHKDKGKFSSEWKKLDDTFVFVNLSGLPLTTLEKFKEKIPEIQSIIDEIKKARDMIKEGVN